MFCRSLFVLLYFFFWSLCCLFLDIRILITPLVSSSSLSSSRLWFLNDENRAKQIRLNHVHNIFNMVCTSYLKKKMFLKINEYHKHNTRSSRFTMQRLKLKASNKIDLQCNSGFERSNPSLIYNCLNKKLNVICTVPVRNWRDESFHINRNYFKWFIILSCYFSNPIFLSVDLFTLNTYLKRH
jgi:hypothetical protein